MKSFARSLAFILRFTATRKWPNHFLSAFPLIQNRTGFSFGSNQWFLTLSSNRIDVLQKTINKSEFEMFHKLKETRDIPVAWFHF